MTVADVGEELGLPGETVGLVGLTKSSSSGVVSGADVESDGGIPAVGTL